MSAKLSRPDVSKSKYTILQLSMDIAGMLPNVSRLASNSNAILLA